MSMTPCRECGSFDDVLDGMCEDCEAEHTWCSVCDAWRKNDSTCRHLCWTDGGWVGSGYCEVNEEWLRESFFALLDLFALVPKWDGDGSGWCWSEKEPAADLPSAILARLRSHGLWARTHGPMLGMPDLEIVAPRPDLPAGCGPLSFAHVRGNWPRTWQKDHAEKYAAAADGYGWLTTLEAQRTPEANALTAGWVEAWLAERGTR